MRFEKKRSHQFLRRDDADAELVLSCRLDPSMEIRFASHHLLEQVTCLFALNEVRGTARVSY